MKMSLWYSDKIAMASLQSPGTNINSFISFMLLRSMRLGEQFSYHKEY